MASLKREAVHDNRDIVRVVADPVGRERMPDDVNVAFHVRRSGVNLRVRTGMETSQVSLYFTMDELRPLLESIADKLAES